VTPPLRNPPDGEARLFWFGVAAAVSGLIILAACAVFAVWLVLAGND
jgi:hypothetical protein